MSSQKNLGLIYKQVPKGFPKAGQDLVVEDIGTDAAKLPSDGIVVRLLWSSLDPYLRGLLRDPAIKSYFPALQPGEAMKTLSIGKVEQSNHNDFKEGDLVQGRLPIQQLTALSGEELKNVQKLDTANGPEDIDQYLGVLGMPGLTA